MSLFQNVARTVNRGVRPLLSMPGIGSILGRSMVELSYVGRKSGRAFSLIVSYKRPQADEIVAWVGGAKHKTWWRNFYPDGGPITVHLPEGDRAGFAVARTSDKGTSVTITLDPA